MEKIFKSIMFGLTVAILTLPSTVMADGGSITAIKVYRLRNSNWAWMILWNSSGGWQGEGSDNKYVYIDEGSNVKIRVEAGGGSFPYTYQLIPTLQNNESVTV